jgi:hypothetical protein
MKHKNNIIQIKASSIGLQRGEMGGRICNVFGNMTETAFSKNKNFFLLNFFQIF